MSYDPSHYTPPRQDRWPNATPQEGWPAYSARDEYRLAAGGTGYWTGNGYGYGGYADPDGYAGPSGYQDQGEYAEPEGTLLIAPDTAALDERGWRPRRSQARDQDAGGAGLIVGAVTGFLAAAVAIGASTLAAAFVRPQAAPIMAVGGAFIDHTPAAVKNFAIQHFGENDKTMLLLGMYLTLALLAMAIGCLARRNAAIGVGGIAAFGLFGAFVSITRPESLPTDVIPSVIGGLAGIAAYAWLAYASAPAPAARRAHAGGRRRIR
jgi:hypothetical protein